MPSAPRYVLSERAAAALRPILQTGSSFGSRPRPARDALPTIAGVCVPALITRAVAGGVYRADFYAEGVDHDSTGSGRVVFIGSSPLQELPVYTWVLAFQTTIDAEHFETFAPATEATA